jgi:RNA 3'-phosphate cyclase
MIELDGSYGEGGGALIRTALALSTLTGKPFTVNNIRAGRPKPGLKAQHLHAIKALTEMCGATTNNIELGSTELEFTPHNIKKGIYNVDIGTAGSITLLLQALILPSLFAPGKVTLRIKGGTAGKWAASVDYLQNILLPQLQRFVEKIELKILKRGYYPKGGGEIKLEITPRFPSHTFESFENFMEELDYKCANIMLTEQHELEQVRGVVTVSADLMEKEVGERIKKSCENSLREYNQPISIRTEYTNTASVGGEVVVWGIFGKGGKVDFDNPIILGGDALVDKRKSSEEIGKEAADELKQEINSEAAVDKHIADMLIPFMGLLPGSKIKTSEITNHTTTNIYVVEKILDVGFSTEKNTVTVKKVNP